MTDAPPPWPPKDCAFTPPTVSMPPLPPPRKAFCCPASVVGSTPLAPTFTFNCAPGRTGSSAVSCAPRPPDPPEVLPKLLPVPDAPFPPTSTTRILVVVAGTV